eukprot:354678_1
MSHAIYSKHNTPSHLLSAGESLRFKSILQLTIDSLKITQILHQKNLTHSTTNVSDIISSTNNRNTEKQTYLNDARMIDNHFNKLIDLLSKTGNELEQNHSWNTLKSFINNKIEIKKETEQLLKEICDTVEQRKQIENDILIEQNEFNKQEQIMLRDINVLQKRFNNLLRESTDDLNYEHAICCAQKSSLTTLHTNKINAIENDKNILSKNIKDD